MTSCSATCVYVLFVINGDLLRKSLIIRNKRRIMRVTSELTDPAILQILGERIERYRVAADLTQAELAERAGVGKRTLERIEAGRGAELVTLIRVLRTLNLLEGLEKLLPEVPPSPIAQLKLRGKQRQRVSRARGSRETNVDTGRAKEGAPTKPWTWGVPPADDLPPAKSARSDKRKK
ncbi:MAG: helix-turn-helix transcriptional regulator [Steroidobacteraceae bacterium]